MASPGTAAARETCPDSSILDSPMEVPRLSRPVVKGVNCAAQVSLAAHTNHTVIIRTAHTPVQTVMAQRRPRTPLRLSVVMWFVLPLCSCLRPLQSITTARPGRTWRPASLGTAAGVDCTEHGRGGSISEPPAFRTVRLFYGASSYLLHFYDRSGREIIIH